MIKLLIILICMFGFIDNYKAENINIEYQEDFYSNVIVDGKIYSNQLSYVLVDNKISFCLDCYYVNINNLDNIKDDDLNYIKLIANYTNENIQNRNVYYYMAAYELIWERVTNNDYYWTNSFGDVIDIFEVKQEIKLYIDNFLIKPSFDGTIVKDNFYTTIQLDDKNKVLYEYKIDNNSNNIVWKDDNKLYIKILSSELNEINLIKKIELTDPIYYSCLNKDLTNFNDSIELISKIQIQANNIYTQNINFNFLDNKNYSFINNKIEFKITNLDNNELINYITTNGIFNQIIEKGIYKLEIVNAPKNYLIPDSIIFEVSENNPYLNIRTLNIYLNNIDNCDDNILSRELSYKLPCNKYYFEIQQDYKNNKRFIATCGLSVNNNDSNIINPIKLIIIILVVIIILFLLKDNYKR